ncbi:MAG TPA: hypothetical protein VNQ77_20040 [Frankiaceae bacterium]|nr:hypothetical protein [Frankiaceae bacterium]
MERAPRTYTGWKAGLTVVFAIVVMVTVVNLLLTTQRSEPDPARPGKVVTTVSP